MEELKLKALLLEKHGINDAHKINEQLHMHYIYIFFLTFIS